MLIPWQHEAYLHNPEHDDNNNKQWKNNVTKATGIYEGIAIGILGAKMFCHIWYIYSQHLSRHQPTHYMQSESVLINTNEQARNN